MPELKIRMSEEMNSVLVNESKLKRITRQAVIVACLAKRFKLRNVPPTVGRPRKETT